MKWIVEFSKCGKSLLCHSRKRPVKSLKKAGSPARQMNQPKKGAVHTIGCDCRAPELR